MQQAVVYEHCWRFERLLLKFGTELNVFRNITWHTDAVVEQNGDDARRHRLASNVYIFIKKILIKYIATKSSLFNS